LLKRMSLKNEEKTYRIILPSKGRGLKEIKRLYKRRERQVEKAIKKLQKFPTNISQKGIEKLKNPIFGQYSIRVAAGDRIFYDVNSQTGEVYILRAGKHDIYKRL